MWPSHAVEYYAALKRMSLENMALSYRSQTQRPHVTGVHLCEAPQTGTCVDKGR